MGQFRSIYERPAFARGYTTNYGETCSGLFSNEHRDVTEGVDHAEGEQGYQRAMGRMDVALIPFFVSRNA